MAIDISYPNGRMTVVLEQFFPAKLKGVKSLLKVIDLDWNKREEHIRIIREWMIEEIRLCESQGKEKKYYVDRKEKLKKNLKLLE